MRTITVTALALLCVAAVAEVAMAQAGHDLFQQALVKERADGDLRGAIAIYERIAREFAQDRTLTAQALVQLGLCYEKLGSTEAERAYQRVVREFPDQDDLVEQARGRLAVLRQQAAVAAPTGPVARRLLEDDGCNIEYMRPSPDGTRVAYVELCGTLAVFVRDLASGDVEQITTEGMHIGIAWSPDGGRLATLEITPRVQLKLIDLETGTVEEPSFLEGVGFMPDDWSSDGEHLAGMLLREDGRSSAVVSLRNGDRIVLAAEVTQALTRTAFSPDGRHVAFRDFTEDNQDIYVLTLSTRERYRVTTAPEADGDAVWSPDGSTIVYHNSLGTWAVRMVEGRTEGEPRLVRSDPYLAPTGSNAWTAIGYYYVTVNTVIRPYRIAIDPETAQALGEPELIADPMADLNHNAQFAWSPDMERIASTGGEGQEFIYVTQGQSVVSYRIGDEMWPTDLWWSAGGNEILFNRRASGHRDALRTLYALDLTDGRIRELFPPTERAHHIHVSSDGASMVFLRPLQIHPDSAERRAGELVVSEIGNAEGGRVLVSTADIDGWLGTHYGQPRFSPDGSHVLYFRLQKVGPRDDDFESSLWVLPTDGSGPGRELGTAPRIDWVHWDPSSRWIAYQEYQGTHEGGYQGVLSVISVETGEKHQILTWGEDMSPGEVLMQYQLKAWSPDGRWIGITQSQGTMEFWVVDDPLAVSAGHGR